MKEVNLSEFQRCLHYLDTINKTPFDEIKWTLNNVEILPQSDELKRLNQEWEFIGLSNCDYGKQLLKDI